MKFSYCNSFNLAINLPMLDEKTKHRYVPLRVSKKTEKPSKPNKPRKKKPIKPIFFFKKFSVRFGFGFRNLKPAKPQPNRTGSI